MCSEFKLNNDCWSDEFKVWGKANKKLFCRFYTIAGCYFLLHLWHFRSSFIVHIKALLCYIMQHNKWIRRPTSCSSINETKQSGRFYHIFYMSYLNKRKAIKEWKRMLLYFSLPILALLDLWSDQNLVFLLVFLVSATVKSYRI